MQLPKDDMKEVLNRMPFCKLSYENHHKKVLSKTKYFQLIPKGKKYLCWFTYYKNKNVIIFVTGQKQFFYYEVPYEKKLALGTIFHGTLMISKNNQFFNIENIHYYKGIKVETKKHLIKLSMMQEILQRNISLTQTTQHEYNKYNKQRNYNKKVISFSLPIMKNTFQEILFCCKNISYKPHSIQTIDYETTQTEISASLYNDQNDENPNIIFLIKADLQSDVYNLFLRGTNDVELYYDIAYIPDYKTSVLMNSFFRKIKENDNLDALEESDDEDEFENIDDDKFVNLYKKIYMECMYSKKFKKYIPVNVSTKDRWASKHMVSQK